MTPVRTSIRTADESTVRLLDGLVVFWLVFWLVMGAWTGYTLWELSRLGDTIANSGGALQTAGEALVMLGDVPVIGDGPASLGSQVVETADEVAARGKDFKLRLRGLSLLLGLSIAVMPTSPVLGLYLPLRLSRRRELGALRRALESDSGSPMLQRYLAQRAVNVLPYETLIRISADPWRDLASGHTGALADAELRRLGLQSPADDR